MGLFMFETRGNWGGKGREKRERKGVRDNRVCGLEGKGDNRYKEPVECGDW